MFFINSKTNYKVLIAEHDKFHYFEKFSLEEIGLFAKDCKNSIISEYIIIQFIESILHYSTWVSKFLSYLKLGNIFPDIII